MDENILHRNHKIKAPQYIIEEDEKHIVKIYRFIPEDTETQDYIICIYLKLKLYFNF